MPSEPQVGFRCDKDFQLAFVGKAKMRGTSAQKVLEEYARAWLADPTVAERLHEKHNNLHLDAAPPRVSHAIVAQSEIPQDWMALLGAALASNSVDAERILRSVRDLLELLISRSAIDNAGRNRENDAGNLRRVDKTRADDGGPDSHVKPARRKAR